jgi:electron transport complex protein RnfG
MSGQKINIPKLGFFLGAVAAISAGLLSGVNGMTAPTIEANKKAAIKTAMDQVLPAYDNDLSAATNTFISGPGWPVTFYTAMKEGEIVGFAGKVDNPDDGFSGVISLMVGLAPDGRVRVIAADGKTNSAVIVTAQTETPGLGTAVTDRKVQKTIVDLIQGSEASAGLVANPFLDWYAGRAGKAEWSAQKEDKGEGINTKTGATITSRAIGRAVYAVSKTAQDHLQELSEGAK